MLWVCLLEDQPSLGCRLHFPDVEAWSGILFAEALKLIVLYGSGNEIFFSPSTKVRSAPFGSSRLL